MYTDEEILYHAFKISQTRDDQLDRDYLTHAFGKKMKDVVSYNKNGTKEAVDWYKDELAYNKAAQLYDSDAVDNYIDQRAKWYAHNTVPKNITGLYVNTIDAASDPKNGKNNYIANDNLQRGAQKWINESKVKILNELHKKFNNPRNPYITEDLNSGSVANRIEDRLREEIINIWER